MATPIALLRPSSAMAMPAKPSPDWKVGPYWKLVTRPGRHADQPRDRARVSMASTTIRVMLMPLATAPVVERPVARRSKPNRVLLGPNRSRKPTTMATNTKP